MENDNYQEIYAKMKASITLLVDIIIKKSKSAGMTIEHLYLNYCDKFSTQLEFIKITHLIIFFKKVILLFQLDWNSFAQFIFFFFFNISVGKWKKMVWLEDRRVFNLSSWTQELSIETFIRSSMKVSSLKFPLDTLDKTVVQKILFKKNYIQICLT